MSYIGDNNAFNFAIEDEQSCLCEVSSDQKSILFIVQNVESDGFVENEFSISYNINIETIEDSEDFQLQLELIASIIPSIILMLLIIYILLKKIFELEVLGFHLKKTSHLCFKTLLRIS